jgi:hypothetical protein
MPLLCDVNFQTQKSHHPKLEQRNLAAQCLLQVGHGPMTCTCHTGPRQADSCPGLAIEHELCTAVFAGSGRAEAEASVAAAVSP